MVDIIGFLTGKKPTFAEVQSDVIKRAKNAELSDAQTATLLKTQLEKYGIPLKKGMKGYKPNKRKQTGMADRKASVDNSKSRGGMPKKAAMMRGGMANGKQHMYAAGGSVTDNAGLRALKKASPEAYKKITQS
jgi:hypothetical protein